MSEAPRLLVLSRFGTATADDPLDAAREVLRLLAGSPGYLRGRVGRAADDPGEWVLCTEWDSVGAYRRGIGRYEVKLLLTPLLAGGGTEASAFEVLESDDGPGWSDLADQPR